MEELLYRSRRGTGCLKWDRLGKKFTRDDLMGLWVADMDFAAPACVREALAEKAEFGVFGYDWVPEGCGRAFLEWEKTWHGYEPSRSWLRYPTSVVAAFHWLIGLFTSPGDGVLIQPPVYYPFAEAIRENGCRVVENRLISTGGVYTVDFADLERKLAGENVKVFLLCSPHNPAGRVWRREELAEMLRLCRRHGVRVISDEIHQDFTHGEHRPIPAASLEEPAVVAATLTSPSKTFNLAGLGTAIAILPDEALRRAYDTFTRRLQVSGGGSFGFAALEAAYTGGRPWLEQVLRTVEENDAILRSALEPKGVTISPLEGTYLAWLDLSARVKEEELPALIEGRCGLAVDYGAWFGAGGEGHVRLNLATRPENVREAARRLADNL